MSEIRQIDVQIMGQSYMLACAPDGEAALRQAVGKVDQAMCAIRDAGKVKARDRIAVLAALNIAYELTQPTSNSTAPSVDTDAPARHEAHGPTAAQWQALLATLDAALADDPKLF
jgi:cell division protein ZapA